MSFTWIFGRDALNTKALLPALLGASTGNGWCLYVLIWDFRLGFYLTRAKR
jgi:hypothetical protein